MFLFNSLKHHLPSIVNFVTQPTVDYLKDLVVIGDSIMDIYTGNLTMEEITFEISTFLEEKQVSDSQSYTAWIQQSGFQKFGVSDGSEWILLIGNEEENYVHLHPARYSPHSLRVKATALKTVISLLIERPEEEPNTETLNEIRSKIGLSPIKSLSESQHLLGLINLIKGRM